MSSSNFNMSLEFTLKWEGGYVNSPRDPGGATLDGVTQRTFSAWLHQHGKSGRRVSTMTKDERTAIYRQFYWAKINADALPSGVDLMAMDVAVNMGPGRVLPWLAASAHMAPKDRIRFLDRKRLGFWRALRTFPIFGRGWVRRETACLAASLALA